MPDYIKFEKNIKVPDMGQYVVVKITGQGRGKIPSRKLRGFRVSERQILLPFGEHDGSDVDLIFKAAYATSAFLSHLSGTNWYCRSDGQSNN